MTALPLPVISVLKGHSSRLRHGHPWLFSNEIVMDSASKALPAGTMVSLVDAGGEQLGVGTFNPRSLIAVRLFSRDPDCRPDQTLLEQRFAAALALRTTLFPAPFYRLVHSEADGLPGLIVDRYGDVLSVQLNTAGMDALWPLLQAALQSVLSPSAIILRNDSPVRTLEGLPLEHRVALGDISGPLEISENGCRLFADLGDGQKTGWFYDQRPNRSFVASLAREKTILDVFCYGGGFGLQALNAGARSATFVDRSADALALVQRSAVLNGWQDKTSTVTGDAFKVMESLIASGNRFGVVVADPPAFAKSRKDIAAGAKGYRKMAKMAATLVEAGGFLLCGSCSHHMPEERFLEEVSRGVQQAGRSGRILWRHGAGADHPLHPSLPESAYLKVIVFQLD